MTGVVAKMFLSTRSEGPRADPAPTYKLGVVCRGELNKDWAAATPSGEAVLYGDVLDEAWASGKREVYVHQIVDEAGDFELRSCDFAYNGCKVTFRSPGSAENGYRTRELTLTVNATAATETLRRAYADGLIAGVAPRFRIDIEPGDDAAGEA